MKKHVLIPLALLLFASFNNRAYAQQADSVIHRLLENNCDFQALKKQGHDERH
ncbi:MAG: hypothetical protein ACKV1O_24565 [Saprospiraceae bacterium]